MAVDEKEDDQLDEGYCWDRSIDLDNLSPSQCEAQIARTLSGLGALRNVPLAPSLFSCTCRTAMPGVNVLPLNDACRCVPFCSCGSPWSTVPVSEEVSFLQLILIVRDFSFYECTLSLLD